MKKLTEIILHIKPVKILLSLARDDKPKYATLISKEADCTYSHTVKILSLFEKYTLISFNKEGRKKIISLTEKGREIAKLADKLLTKLDELED